ncbi:uncharacterized protein LOC123214096 isoform X2 [Mangifera indica]|uniref:uncharacterized protein LOC123214096 isoform X2 n=1 Tax=Mangifera indica TaxID=29780 RepID=UPI001CF9DF6E|nr:uncharacterized protein LOC123214096 isoform X2 [Mangifera indica]
MVAQNMKAFVISRCFPGGITVIVLLHLSSFSLLKVLAHLCRLPMAMAGKMNLVSNSSRTSGYSSIQFGNLRPIHIGTDVQFEADSLIIKASKSTRSYSKHEMDIENEDFLEEQSNFKRSHGRKKRIDLGSERLIGNVCAPQLGDSCVSSSTSFRDKGKPNSTRVETSPHGQRYSKHGMSYKKLDCSKGSGPSKHGMSHKKLDFSGSSGLFNVKPFDICVSRSSFRHYTEDKENHNELEPTEDRSRQEVLRPGMVLLKQYLRLNEQIEIVKTCQELGKGPGGFYQPGYKDGAKLRLHMMCLGLDWDPQTRKYEKQRRVDGCEPPHIPQSFNQYVHTAISDSYALIKKEFRLINVEDMLPAISPNIGIVNFYTTSGRLGLHQDRDESCESLRKGLPVVSFSIGDSAKFLYGDERDIDKAETVVLESGDVLIFGGESRHIFHGVSSIIPNSAPGSLLKQSNLRPGRLNLTFRQY